MSQRNQPEPDQTMNVIRMFLPSFLWQAQNLASSYVKVTGDVVTADMFREVIAKMQERLYAKPDSTLPAQRESLLAHVARPHGGQ